MIEIKKILPAGRYFIGDPCYVMDDQDWLRFCHYFDVVYEGKKVSPEEQADLIAEFEGAIAGYTTYGDGVYSDVEDQHFFSLDSGLIGFIEESYWKCYSDLLNKQGLIKDFDEAFIVMIHGGRYYINNRLFIDTNI